MKKLKRTIVALLLVFAMIVCPFSAIGQPSIVQAATVKINKSEITITKGKTYQLKISGTKKKITWKTFDKSVASVNSKGKVSAKGIGSTVVYGKIGGKYYHCVVNVIEKYKKSTAEKNVSCKLTKIKREYESYELAIFENKNSFPVDLEIQLLFKNSAGKVISTESDSYSCMPANSKSTCMFYIPTKSNYDCISFSSCSIEYEVNKSTMVDYSSNISVSSSKGEAGIIIKSTNNGKKSIDYASFGVVFYDSNNKIVGYSGSSTENFSSGKTKYLEASFPEKKFAKYKVFIDQAYSD